MADDTVTFCIAWEGVGMGHVQFIIDNDKVVASEYDRLNGGSPLELTYQRSRASIHVIEWSLWFPGKSARKLTATISINGGRAITLDQHKDALKNKWISRGAAP